MLSRAGVRFGIPQWNEVQGLGPWWGLGRSPDLGFSLRLHRLMRRTGGDVDDLADAGVHGDELDGVAEADQEGADGAAAAQAGGEAGGDVGGVEAGHDEDVGGAGEAAEGV